MKTCKEMVAEFMRRIGAAVPDGPVAHDPALAALRMSLVLEEHFETHKALADGDVVGALDGFADLKYVVVGTAVAYGLPFDDFHWEPVHDRRAPDARDAASFAVALGLPLARLAQALAGEGDLHDALRAVDRELSMEAAMLGLPLREAFEAVHASNMTKEPGAAIGAVKYGKGGGKGPGYAAPDLVAVLESAGWPEGAGA